jgi:hypothetical protein
MIGETLHSPRRFPWVACIFVTLGALCVAVALGTGEWGWAVFAALPGALGVTLLLRQREEFHAELRPFEIAVHSSNETIPYAEIKKIWWSGKKLNDPIYLIHSRGVLEVPAIDGVATADLRSFLESAVPHQQYPAVHGAIADYLHTQATHFGNDRVWAYVAGENFKRSDGRLTRSIYLALAIAAAAWVAAGIASNNPGWFGGAVMLGVVALIVLLIRTSTHGIDRRIKNWRDSSLVVTPVGIALVQGDLKGELRWRELQDVQFREGSSAARRRIQLKVAGARIDIMDFYDAPLREIHQRIDEFWRAQ